MKVLLFLVFVVLAALAVYALVVVARRPVGRRRVVRPIPPTPPFTAHWWSPNDIACARVLSKARFSPGAPVTLPSGRTVRGADIPHIAAIRKDGDV